MSRGIKVLSGDLDPRPLCLKSICINERDKRENLIESL